MAAMKVAVEQVRVVPGGDLDAGVAEQFLGGLEAAGALDDPATERAAQIPRLQPRHAGAIARGLESIAQGVAAARLCRCSRYRFTAIEAATGRA